MTSVQMRRGKHVFESPKEQEFWQFTDEGSSSGSGGGLPKDLWKNGRNLDGTLPHEAAVERFYSDDGELVGGERPKYILGQY